MKSFIYSILALSIVAATSTAAYAADSNQSAGWDFSLAVGSVSAPAYLGADTQQLSAVPSFNINYADRFFASISNAAGYNLINANGWRAGPIAKYDFGRLENGDNPLLIGGDETTELMGLGDLDGAAEIGGFLEYTYQRVTGKIEARQAMGGHDGMIAEVALNYNGSIQLLGKKAYYGIGPELIFGDENYNSAYFGVTPSQAASSGLSEYDAGTGLVSYGLDFSLFVPIDQHVSVIGFAKYARLAADAEKSSLVAERGSPDQALAGLLLSYSF
ncbi:MAG: outer membrane protein [Granulosicoccus sp.]|jgi:outer membrane protein